MSADIEEFNNSKSTDFQEKITLYLCGLGHLAREVMLETNAKTFEAKTTLESKEGKGTVEVTFKAKAT